jgi:putative transposase
LPYNGRKPKRGPTPRYGDKLDDRNLPADALCQTVHEGHLVTQGYQLSALHKDFSDPLNGVVLVKTNRRTHQRTHGVLLSPDLSLSAAPIVDYDRLRFPIAFNFRDAQQYWGLEDCMNLSPTAVTHATNLAFLMVNLSVALLQPYRQQQPDFSLLDLKTHFRARRYLHETIQSFPDPPSSDLVSRLWQRISALGGIRPPSIRQDAA